MWRAVTILANLSKYGYGARIRRAHGPRGRRPTSLARGVAAEVPYDLAWSEQHCFRRDPGRRRCETLSARAAALLSRRRADPVTGTERRGAAAQGRRGNSPSSAMQKLSARYGIMLSCG